MSLPCSSRLDRMLGTTYMATVDSPFGDKADYIVSQVMRSSPSMSEKEASTLRLAVEQALMAAWANEVVQGMASEQVSGTLHSIQEVLDEIVSDAVEASKE